MHLAVGMHSAFALDRAGTVTVAYLPSTAFPTGPSRDGLPIACRR